MRPATQNRSRSTPARPPGWGRRPGCAFTLVELLVVVAIIALLVGIILPSLGRVRAHTRLVLCQTRLNGQLNAHALYAADHDDAKPPLMRKGRVSIRLDPMSPDVKWLHDPVGQGILVKQGLIEFDSLLCPAASMVRDAAQDRDDWRKLPNAGSSFVYFWRHPSTLKDLKTEPEPATYADAVAGGWPGLSMDVNALQGHPFLGEYEGRDWVSHPGVGRVNVAYIGGGVRSFDNQVLVLRDGSAFGERRWWEQAHELGPR